MLNSVVLNKFVYFDKFAKFDPKYYKNSNVPQPSEYLVYRTNQSCWVQWNYLLNFSMAISDPK